MTDKVAEKADELKAKLPDPKVAAKTAWQQAKPFVNGGASGMLSTCLIQPVDMVKVRLQLGATGSPVSMSPQRLHTFPSPGLSVPGLPSAEIARETTWLVPCSCKAN